MMRATPQEVEDRLNALDSEFGAVVRKLQLVAQDYGDVLPEVIAGLPADQAVYGATNLGELHGRLEAAVQIAREVSAQLFKVRSTRLVPKDGSW